MNKILFGLLLYTLAMVIFSQSNIFMGLIIAMFVFTFGEVVVTIGSAPVMSKLVPANMMARASSVIGIFYTIGHLIAINIPGYLLKENYSYEHTWLVIAVVGLVAIAYFVWFKAKFSATLDFVDDFEGNRK
jgi:MFS family permease